MKVVLEKGAVKPRRSHDTDAGADIRCQNGFTIEPFGCAMVDTGIHVEIPHGYFGAIRPRSSMFRKGIMTDGTIDEGYTGSIGVCLWNLTDKFIDVDPGDKIAQLVIIPCRYEKFEVVDRLDDTDRGDGGWGSTGR